MSKKTIFFVTDVETTYRNRTVFDLAWKAIDRKNKVYSTGSYLITDALKLDVPFFKEKLGYYFEQVGKQKIEPVPFRKAKFLYNKAIREFQNQGNRVVFCAYNAAFDSVELGKTSKALNNEPFLEQPLEIMDIWYYWAKDCPLNYTAKPTATGKNLSTTAESVYKFELKDHRFIEQHIAYMDCEDEAEILLKILRRKKSMPIVKNPSQLVSNVWRVANDRIKRKAA